MPDHYKKMPNAATRVGQGKVRMAHYGRDSIGLKMKNEDRIKLLKSGARDLIEGKKQQNTLRTLPRPPKPKRKPKVKN